MRFLRFYPYFQKIFRTFTGKRWRVAGLAGLISCLNATAALADVRTPSGPGQASPGRLGSLITAPVVPGPIVGGPRMTLFGASPEAASALAGKPQPLVGGQPPTVLPATAPSAAAPLAAVHAGLLCRRAIQMAGRAAGIPEHLMSAIGRVESGRRGPDGLVHPWPWSINVEGIDHVFDTREQAISAVHALQAQGTRSIDVGCMQVNLMYHPEAFASLDLAFDPAANAAYAARFLSQLYAQTGSWPKATGMYHSATPELGAAYQLKVASVLAEETATDTAFAGRGILPTRVAGIVPGAASGAGAIMLSNHAAAAHILPQINPGAGRGLDAYRAAPVRVAARAFP